MGISPLLRSSGCLSLSQALYSLCRFSLIDSHFLSLGIDRLSPGIAYAKLKEALGLAAVLFGPSFDFAQDERWSVLRIRHEGECNLARRGVALVVRRILSGA